MAHDFQRGASMPIWMAQLAGPIALMTAIAISGCARDTSSGPSTAGSDGASDEVTDEESGSGLATTGGLAAVGFGGEGGYCGGIPETPESCDSALSCGLVYYQYPQSLCNPAFVAGGDGAVFSMTVLAKESIAGDCSVPLEQSGREDIDHTWYLVDVDNVLRGEIEEGQHWVYTAGAAGVAAEGATKGPSEFVPLDEGESVVVVAWWDEQTQAKGQGAWLVTSDGQVFRPMGSEWSYGVHFPYNGSGVLEDGLETLVQHFAGMDDGSVVCPFQQESTFSGKEEHYPGWDDDATPIPSDD